MSWHVKIEMYKMKVIMLVANMLIAIDSIVFTLSFNKIYLGLASKFTLVIASRVLRKLSTLQNQVRDT